MIVAVNAENRTLFGADVTKMYCERKNVFADRVR